MPTPTNSRRVPLEKRKRTETSCDKCKSRKQKCRKEPGQDACRYCMLHNIACLTTQPRKKRLYGSVEGLGHRLALLESLVKGLLPEADVANMEELRRLGSEYGIPLPKTGDGEGGAGGAGSESEEGCDEPLTLLPDQQGQVQYIGPASSFSYHLKLRSLVGQTGLREFVLFGRNAAEREPIAGEADHQALSTPSAASTTIDHGSPAETKEAATDSLELLMAAYFEQINPDFPVLHEPSFRDEYQTWILHPDQADPAWLCGFLCALLLARRVAHSPSTFPEEQEKLWWRRVQALLPVVVFTSNMSAVRALMLAALHLHNTNHRDACWNLTGTAIRIAVAIGLHQERVNKTQPPLARELRKCLWWSLYTFEQMQVSSYDRPSAIEPSFTNIGYPNTHIIGYPRSLPPDYSKRFCRLFVLLAAACRAPKNTRLPSTAASSSGSGGEESYVGPLSPAAGVLRDLDRWRESLPAHLRLEAGVTAPPSFQRPLLLLHAQFHYNVIVLCRCALMMRAHALKNEGRDPTNLALTGMADACVASGRQLGEIMIKMDVMGVFDAVTWWDIWYVFSAATILVLEIVCATSRAGAEDSTAAAGEGHGEGSRALLEQLAKLATKHSRNPQMPGTIQKWASIVPELKNMATSIKPAAATASSTASEPAPLNSAPEAQHTSTSHTHTNHQTQPQLHAEHRPPIHPADSDYAFSLRSTSNISNNGNPNHPIPDTHPYIYTTPTHVSRDIRTSIFADTTPDFAIAPPYAADLRHGRYTPDRVLHNRILGERELGERVMGNRVLSEREINEGMLSERSTQNSFMDYTMHSFPDWGSWGDIGSLLGGGEVGEGHGHGHGAP